MVKKENYIDKYYLKEFKNYLIANDKSEKTIKTYLDNVILFIEFFNEMNIDDFHPSIVTHIDIIDYRSYCQTTFNLSVSSINIRIASLKSYFSWLKIEGIIDKDVTINIKKLKDARTKEAKSFSEKTYRALRRLYYREGIELHICIFELLSKCGLRVGELVNLKLDDIEMNFNENNDIRKGTIEVIGKGNKYRSIPLHKDARKAIINWIKVREKRKSDSPYLLISERKNRKKFTTNGIYRIVKKYHEKLGIDDVYSVHSYRHYFCRTLLKNGADLSTVAALAGHSSAVVTSQIYTLPNAKEKQDAISKLL